MQLPAIATTARARYLLKKYGTVEIDKNQTIICIVGDFISNEKGTASKVFNALKKVPIRMISYGGSKNNVSILVETKNKVDALLSLNEGIFKPSDDVLV